MFNKKPQEEKENSSQNRNINQKFGSYAIRIFWLIHFGIQNKKKT